MFTSKTQAQKLLLIVLAVLASMIVLNVAWKWAHGENLPTSTNMFIGLIILTTSFLSFALGHNNPTHDTKSNDHNPADGEKLESSLEKIEAQRRQLEVILNSTTDGILAIDKSDTITIANQATAKLCLSEPEKLVGKKIDDVLPLQRGTEALKIDYQAEGTHTYPSLQYTTPDDVIHYLNIITVKTANQTIITLHDETKSRELENMKVDFVSMAAHELRTPLSRIRGYLELATAQSGDSLSDSVKQYIENSHNSALELSTLISNLLDVSRIERGKLVLVMEKIDIAQLAAEAAKSLNPGAAAKKISLTYVGDEKGHYVVGDNVALKEVVGNLIDNAIHYTPLEGKVEVTVAEEEDAYTIQVKDTGIGIPASSIPYLFTKFYRVHGGLESGSSGTGLGLFIAKSIVERHNGKVAVKSKEGSGSTFTVTLPKYSEERFAELREKEGLENGSKRRGWTTKNIAR